MKTLSGLLVEKNSKVFANVTDAVTFLMYNSLKFVLPCKGACVAVRIDAGVVNEEYWNIFECKKGAIICITFKDENENKFFAQMTEIQYDETINILSLT